MNSPRRNAPWPPKNGSRPDSCCREFLPDPSDSDIEGWQAICSSDVYVLLTEVRGWTSEQYVRWISEITQAALAAKGVV